MAQDLAERWWKAQKCLLGVWYTARMLMQAMMELGACICTVHQPPACGACPIQMHCQAYRDMQEYISQGADVTQTDAPVVTQYPSKVRGSCVCSHCTDLQKLGRIA